MEIHGWGRYPRIQAERHRFESNDQLKTLILEPIDYISFGKGRSYGDSALNQHVILTDRYNSILAFDGHTGRLTCQSGVTLAELISVFAPRGWFLRITPGTQTVSVGGAIASDIHGKNHHLAGCFSECVQSFDLMLPEGRIRHCSRHENRDLFEATCGGMGLTGVILTVTLDLMPIQSASVCQIVTAACDLAHILQLFDIHRNAAYSVAWIDCLAGGASRGRAVMMRGEHADDGNLDMPPKRQLTVPPAFPGALLNKYTVKWFNQWYYRRRVGGDQHRMTSLADFFYPLDALSDWNRLYGNSGFTQYQLVVPKDAGRNALDSILKRVAAAGCGSFLAVLKLLGPANANWLSFPMEGYTLALDFKISPPAMALMDELDRLVLDCGGRLYLSKDVRMPRSVFQSGYPNWQSFADFRRRLGLTGKFQSMQSRRLGL